MRESKKSEGPASRVFTFPCEEHAKLSDEEVVTEVVCGLLGGCMGRRAQTRIEDAL